MAGGWLRLQRSPFRVSMLPPETHWDQILDTWCGGVGGSRELLEGKAVPSLPDTGWGRAGWGQVLSGEAAVLSKCRVWIFWNGPGSAGFFLCLHLFFSPSLFPSLSLSLLTSVTCCLCFSCSSYLFSLSLSFSLSPLPSPLPRISPVGKDPSEKPRFVSV